MPKFDGTGPLGQGVGFGRGMGPCGAGSGICPGRGLGQRLRRERFISPKNELAALEKEKEFLFQELEIIKEEIEFLKADK